MSCTSHRRPFSYTICQCQPFVTFKSSVKAVRYCFILRLKSLFCHLYPNIMMQKYVLMKNQSFRAVTGKRSWTFHGKLRVLFKYYIVSVKFLVFIFCPWGNLQRKWKVTNENKWSFFPLTMCVCTMYIYKENCIICNFRLWLWSEEDICCVVEILRQFKCLCVDIMYVLNIRNKIFGCAVLHGRM